MAPEAERLWRESLLIPDVGNRERVKTKRGGEGEGQRTVGNGLQGGIYFLATWSALSNCCTVVCVFFRFLKELLDLINTNLPMTEPTASCNMKAGMFIPQRRLLSINTTTLPLQTRKGSRLDSSAGSESAIKPEFERRRSRQTSDHPWLWFLVF